MTEAPRKIGRYLLHHELASGGMATVWLGRIRAAGGFARPVAIKRLHPQFAKDPAFVEMFLDEARLAARIRHQNVIPTTDVAVDGEEPVLVMEYVHGESLARLIGAARRRNEPIEPGVAATVMIGVLEGLHAAHQATNERGVPLGLVHRDVSPQNVLVGVDGVSRVLDFGIAKALGRAQTTQEGQLKGKMPYMAPEQMEGKRVDRRVDVWAASVVLWEALTSTRLFEADDAVSLVTQVREKEIPAPSTLAKVSPELDAVVMRGLSRDPARRFATARDMAVALEKAVVPAPSRVVGQWAQRLARDVLESRAAKIEEMESDSSRESAASGPTTQGLVVDLPPAPGDDLQTVASPRPVLVRSSAPPAVAPVPPPANAPLTARRRALPTVAASFVLVASVTTAFAVWRAASGATVARASHLGRLLAAEPMLAAPLPARPVAHFAAEVPSPPERASVPPPVAPRYPAWVAVAAPPASVPSTTSTAAPAPAGEPDPPAVPAPPPAPSGDPLELHRRK